ncbi:pseudouridine synthase [Pseudonocardia sp. CA-107938]|uniref:pseudouridine synthase n=1 Tax=Pseudonocardia sp. CA-107938 TaxID=3240021 RepID=UPI003D907DD1
MRLRTPVETRWSTMREHLVERLPRVPAERIDAMLAEQRFVGSDGPIAPDAAYEPLTYVWFHRDLPVEAPVPFPIEVVHRDEHLLVVDKPHFMATIPRGQHILETALVRLRREHDLPDLSPAHRLDRMTAGLLMFVVRREHRGAYQTLFRDRRVHKTYEAVARHDPALELPRTVRSRIVKERGVIRAQEVAGPDNAETLVELLEHRAGLGRYRLTPTTGRTHQLRLHMSSLGVPIVGDDFYPVLTERALDDFGTGIDADGTPLQLLAATLEFTDPVTGAHRRFRTRRTLAAWPVAPD